MADSYRSRSRRSETPSSSSSGGSHHSSPGQYYHSSAHSSGPSHLSYQPVNPAQYSYHPAAPPSSQHGVYSPYGPYSSPSPPHLDDAASRHGHHRSSSGLVPTGVAPRHSSYPGPAASDFTSERASKRQRATTVPPQSQMPAQWVDPSAHGYHQPAGRRSDTRNSTAHGSRRGDRSSESSGYNSPPGYSHGSPHDPYGQQIFHSPSLVPSAGPSNVDMYDMRHSRRPSSDDDTEHGPTELPPRTYTGKSQYDPPKKPGKIPGSAMDYLPILEARFDRLENAIDKYVDLRGKQALSNSILPGMDSYETSSGREGHLPSSRRSRETTRR